MAKRQVLARSLDRGESKAKAQKRVRLYIERLPVLPALDIFGQLDRDGYCIIPCVIDPAFCASIIDDMWGWLRALGTGIDRDKPDTWGSDRWPPNVRSIIQHFGIGHAQHAWRLRQDPRIVRIFQQLWKSEDLITSFDGCCIVRPPEITGRGWATKRAWWHTDQRPQKIGRHCVQGWVTMEDIEAGDATLRVLAGSHLHHHKLTRPAQKDWYKLEADEIKTIQENCPEVRIQCPKGSMVLWDSRTIHCNVDPERGRAHARWRFVQYLCMHPRAFATESELAKKQEAFRNNRTTSHWPSPVALVSMWPQTYGKPGSLCQEVKEPFRDTLEPLGRRLAGH